MNLTYEDFEGKTVVKFGKDNSGMLAVFSTETEAKHCCDYMDLHSEDPTKKADMGTAKEMKKHYLEISDDQYLHNLRYWKELLEYCAKNHLEE